MTITQVLPIRIYAFNDYRLEKTIRFVENDSFNHSRDVHCNEYLAQQSTCCAEQQSCSAERLVAFRHQIVIISDKQRRPFRSPLLFSQTQRTVPCVQAFNARKFFVFSAITREILHNSISSAVKEESRNVKSDFQFASLPCRRVIFPFRTIYPHI